MNKLTLRFIFFALILFFVIVPNAYGQFMNLQIKIESEISITVEQDLDFGTLVSNTGSVSIQLGDLNMGVFSIKAFKSQSVYVDLIFPENLQNINPSINDLIPLELFVSFNNNGERDISRATLLESGSGLISNNFNSNSNSSFFWEEILLYIYGNLTIDDIANGEYEGEVQLVIQYQ